MIMDINVEDKNIKEQSPKDENFFAPWPIRQSTELAANMLKLGGSAAKEFFLEYGQMMALTTKPYSYEDLKIRMATYLNLMLRTPKEQDWATPNSIVCRDGLMNLRHFDSPFAKNKYSVLILPPQSGNDSKIADYTSEQSLVRTFQRQGFDVFVTEWLSASSIDGNLGIKDYIGYTNSAVEKIIKFTREEKVIMVGESQGGWQAAMYASLYPDKVAGLAIAAAPIDFDAKEGVLNKQINSTPMCIYENMIELNNNVASGKALQLGKKSLQMFENNALKTLRIFNMSMKQDLSAIQRYIRYDDWSNNTQDLPGKFYLESIKHVFKDNCLANPGSYSVDGRPVNLKNISCPLVLIGGEKDYVALPQQVFAMKNLVSTNEGQITQIMAPEGHTGILIGNDAMKKTWPIVCQKLRKIK